MAEDRQGINLFKYSNIYTCNLRNMCYTDTNIKKEVERCITFFADNNKESNDTHITVLLFLFAGKL